MASYGSAGTRNQATAQTQRVLSIPTFSAGQMAIAIVGSENNANHSINNGNWNKFGQVNSGATWTVSVWWKILQVGDTNPTVSWTGSADAFSQVFLLNGPFDSAPIGNSSSNTGSASPHTVNGVNSTRNNSLIIYIGGANANTAYGAPGGSWTEHADNGSNTGPGRNVIGSRTLATSGSASGNLSLTGAAAAWVLWQIEILDQSTRSGAGAVTGPTQTVSGSGTATIPERTGSGAINAPTQQVSGAGTRTVPQFNGAGAVNAPLQSVSGAGTFVGINRTGSGAVTAPVQSVSGDGVAQPPQFNLSGDLVAPLQVVSGTGTRTLPQFAGSGSVSAPSPQIAGAGTVTAPQYQGSGDIIGPVQVVNGSGTRTIPERSGSGAIVAPAQVVSGAGTVSAAGVNGFGNVTAPLQQVSGTGEVDALEFSGGGAVQAPSPVVSGTGTRTVPSLNESRAAPPFLVIVPIRKQIAISGAMLNQLSISAEIDREHQFSSDAIEIIEVESKIRNEIRL